MTNEKKMLGCNSYSICCTPESQDYNDLCYEDKQRFGYLVNRLRKQGHDLKTAQKMAYQNITCESIPFEPNGR